MRSKLVILLFIVYCLLSIVPSARADYVLPYPSYMPGNKMYKVTRLLDRLKAYWYWGDIASVKYHLSLSDKYLVEAKTLFEYKQYLLAADALTRSDQQLEEIPDMLRRSRSKGVDIHSQIQIVEEAMKVHIDVINSLKDRLPEAFTWTPEKENATTIPISSILSSSVIIRENLIDGLRNQ